MKNPNITGIIQSINRLVEACLGSAAGMVLIFCMRNIDTPTRTGQDGRAIRQGQVEPQKVAVDGDRSMDPGQPLVQL